jgi:hypothetical protein
MVEHVSAICAPAKNLVGKARQPGGVHAASGREQAYNNVPGARRENRGISLRPEPNILELNFVRKHHVDSDQARVSAVSRRARRDARLERATNPEAKEVAIKRDGTLLDTARLSWHGLPVARLEMRARPVDTVPLKSHMPAALSGSN